MSPPRRTAKRKPLKRNGRVHGLRHGHRIPQNNLTAIPANAGMAVRLDQRFAMKRAQPSSGDTQQSCSTHSRLVAMLAP